MTTKKVLVIGCGPAGIAQNVAFNQYLKDKSVEITCYEMGSEIGGLWTYNPSVGDDVHHSMYIFHQVVWRILP